MQLDFFFNPASVAVIGASNDKTKVGYSLVFNVEHGARRKIFPVSLKEPNVLGLPAYRSVAEVPGTIDLAIIAIPAPAVPSVLEECGKKKVHAAVVISSGFKETGAAGAELEKKIQALAAAHRIALLGPNCLGVIDAHARLNASFAADKPLPGTVALLSQSGALGAAMLDFARQAGVGFSKFISLGNEAALNELDFLEYLGDDRDTEAILLYLERVSDGPRFMKLVERAVRKKPVVVLKAGRSGKGAAAVLSHTGSLAPESAVFEAACRQCGVLPVATLRAFYNLVKLFQLGITKPLPRLAILTNGGGPSVVAADLVELSSSLSLAEFSDGTRRALGSVLPPAAAVGNPVDILGDALAARYDAALKILAAQKNVDGILALLTPQMMTQSEATAGVLAGYRKKKPIIPVFMGGEAVARGVAKLRENGMANYLLPDAAIEALDALSLAKKPALAAAAPSRGAQKLMGFSEARALLKKYGIAVEGEAARKKDELDALLKKFKGRPAALKVLSPNVSHKTDIGGVRLNIQSAEEARRAWDEIIAAVRAKAPNAKIDGILVQPTAEGKETLVGMKRDDVFGSVITFGLGGIFTETLKDVALRVAPVDERTAREMIDEIRGASVLRGLRGEPPVNFKALVKLIAAVSKLSLVHPEIQELDLNPVVVNDKTAAVVDARIVI